MAPGGILVPSVGWVTLGRRAMVFVRGLSAYCGEPDDSSVVSAFGD